MRKVLFLPPRRRRAQAQHFNRDVSLNDIVSTRLVVGRRGIRRLYSSVLIVDRHLNKRVEDMANEKLRTDSGSERVVWDQTRDLHSFGSGKVAKTDRNRFKVRRPALLSYLSVQDARRAREIIVFLTNK